MANQIYPSNGLIYQLTQIVSGSPVLGLFTNNYTITDASLFSNLTEAGWTSYARITLTSGNWVSLGVAGGIGTIAYPTCTFTNGSVAAVTTYGYFILDPTSTYLLAAGNFAGAPITLAASGGTYSFIPTWADKSQY
jgi:hypothetical protein